MDDVTKKLNRELELIQTIGHLLQKAGEADVEICMSGWALEGAGRMIVNSASEIRETLEEEGAKPNDHHTRKPREV